MSLHSTSASGRAEFLRTKTLLLLLTIGGFSPLQAQVPPPETVEQRRFGVVPDFSAPHIRFGQSAEVGTLEQVERIRPPDTFTLHTSQTYYRTDNLFLSTPNPQNANAWI